MVVLCDGCYQQIPTFRGRIHNVRVSKGKPIRHHACSTACVRKIKANLPAEPRCPDCNERVATGHPCVCKAQNKPPKVPT